MQYCYSLHSLFCLLDGASTVLTKHICLLDNNADKDISSQGVNMKREDGVLLYGTGGFGITSHVGGS